MIKDLIENFIQRWQDKCPHDMKYRGNIGLLDNYLPGCSLLWCYRCGAYSAKPGEWRKPKAAWATRAGI